MNNQTIGYCVRCKEKREISNPEEVIMKRKGGKTGRAMTGICPTCGTKMFRILPSKKEETATPENETTIPEVGNETSSFDDNGL